MPRLTIEGICKTFPHVDNPNERLSILQDVSLWVDKTEIVGVIGPSGCGKTTLLRIAAGLITADKGMCRLNGDLITGPRRDIAVVFQLFNLLPWRSTLENVEFGLELQHMPKAARQEKAAYYLNLVGLNGFERNRPDQLSGGMQQRVGLARALAIEPEALLMDEPFGSLDHQTAERLRDELLKIQAKTQKMILLITHNIDEAIYVSDRIIVLGARPGRVVKEIPLDFPTPRWEHDIYSQRRFGEVRSELKHLLIGS